MARYSCVSVIKYGQPKISQSRTNYSPRYLEHTTSCLQIETPPGKSFYWLDRLGLGNWRPNIASPTSHNVIFGPPGILYTEGGRGAAEHRTRIQQNPRGVPVGAGAFALKTRDRAPRARLN